MEARSIVERSDGRSSPAGAIVDVNAAVVLGARNLGGAITRELLAHEVRVATVARTQADLDALKADGAVPVRADAAESESLTAALARATDEIGPPDLIVNAVSAT